MAEIAPALHAVSVPATTLLVLYTDGVSERDRKSIQGEAQLREAVIFAYTAKHSGSNLDDAAILTAWTLGAPILRGRSTRHVRAERLRALDLDHGMGVVCASAKSE